MRKGRKLRSLLSWVLTLTMLFGTFGGNCIPALAGDEDPVPATEVLDGDGENVFSCTVKCFAEEYFRIEQENAQKLYRTLSSNSMIPYVKWSGEGEGIACFDVNPVIAFEVPEVVGVVPDIPGTTDLVFNFYTEGHHLFEAGNDISDITFAEAHSYPDADITQAEYTLEVSGADETMFSALHFTFFSTVEWVPGILEEGEEAWFIKDSVSSQEIPCTYVKYGEKLNTAISAFPEVHNSNSNKVVLAWVEMADLGEEQRVITLDTTISQNFICVGPVWGVAPEHTHRYPGSTNGSIPGQVVWSWDGNESSGYTAKVTLYCISENCVSENHAPLTLEAGVTSEEEIVPYDNVCYSIHKVYKATAEYEGNTYTDTSPVIATPVYHRYHTSTGENIPGQVEWNWSGSDEEGYSAEVTVYCTNEACMDPDHGKKVLPATVKESGASCTKDAGKIWTATANWGDAVYTNVKEAAEKTPAYGHIWEFDTASENVVWIGNDDEGYTAAIITKKCLSISHNEAVDGPTEVSVSVNTTVSDNGAKCGEVSIKYYTATFDSSVDPDIKEAFSFRKEVAGNTVSHNWVVTSVSSNGSFEIAPTEATMTIECANDATHTETVSATSISLVSSNDTQKTYKYEGTASDKQAVSYEEVFYSHTEHDWTVVFTWVSVSINKVETQVTAEATCKNGGEKKDLVVTVTDKTIGSKIEYTASATDPNGKVWTSRKNIDKDGNVKDGPAGQPLVEGGDIVIVGLNEDGYPFSNKKAITPAFTVMDGDVTLALGTDYSVKYKNNKAVTDAAIVEVTGKGNYQGKSTSATFEIYDPVAKAKEDGVELIDGTVKKIDKIAAVTYNGLAQYPEQIVVTMKDKSTVTMKHEGDGVYVNASEDATAKQLVVTVTNNVNKGSAIVAVAAGDGTVKTASFKINAADISTATVADNMEATFAVKGTRPGHITVLWKNGDDEEVELVEGQDFTVSLKDNKAVGTGKLILKGKGNFAKKNESGTFKINALVIDSADDIAGVAAFEGVKASAVKVTVLDGQGVALPAKALTVAVKDAEGNVVEKKTKLAAGNYTVVVTSKNSNVTIEGDGVEKEITVGANIGKAKVDAKKLTVTYTGAPIELTKEQLDSVIVTVKVGKEKKTLVADEDYKVVGYTNNVKKGNMIVTIEGTGVETERGTFSGTKTFKVKIVAKNLDAKAE
ncbi:MAG: hypothetical protein IJM34_06315 [Lachnospiraceae bacterium]|nr:hypothetical protein [Lachnospiraceae bacterium]